MKSILLSIRPEWVAKILNGEKTIEIRKKFPKDYVGWVYIYCTKSTHIVRHIRFKSYAEMLSYELGEIDTITTEELNGKVVARFWCDKVEDIYAEFADSDYYDLPISSLYFTTDYCENEHEDIAELSCLYYDDLCEYLNKGKELGDEDEDWRKKFGYAIHISKLEVFDRPRELREFNSANGFTPCKKCLWSDDCWAEEGYIGNHCNSLYKAPQNYCYIESEK